jgi:hypothetical protein
LPGKKKEEKTVIVAANLTETEKNAIYETVAKSGLDTTTIIRRLIHNLNSGKRTWPELLQKYMKASVANGFSNETPELRIHRINVRLSQKEKENLVALAVGAFYRPGEFIRILLLLFAIGVVKPGELWE